MSHVRRLRNLTTDGCSNSPDEILWADIYPCCQHHDQHYRNPDDTTRAQADRELRQCMQEKGLVISPWIYWGFVRLFGGRAWRKHR